MKGPRVEKEPRRLPVAARFSRWEMALNLEIARSKPDLRGDLNKPGASIPYRAS
jgi:hypothetical protein